MLIYTLRRILLAVPTLLGITVVTFVIINLAPGDPAQFQTAGIMDPKVSIRVYEQLREYYGLDKPIHVRYVQWLGRLVQLDFGESMSTDRRKVLDKIAERIWPTMSLALLSIGISLVLSVPIGVYSAARQNKLFDTVSSTILYALYSVPSYVMAVPLILFIGVKWDLLPFQGMTSDNYEMLTAGGKVADLAKHYVLITFCFSFGAWAYYSRFVRQNMLEVVRQDYIRTARAKGVSESRVIVKHAFRNTLIPLMTPMGVWLPAVIGGAGFWGPGVWAYSMFGWALIFYERGSIFQKYPWWKF